MATPDMRANDQGHEASDPATAEGPGPIVDSRRGLTLTAVAAAVLLAVVVLALLLSR